MQVLRPQMMLILPASHCFSFLHILILANSAANAFNMVGVTNHHSGADSVPFPSFFYKITFISIVEQLTAHGFCSSPKAQFRLTV